MNHNRLLSNFLGDPFEWWRQKEYPPKEEIEALIKNLEELRIVFPNDYYVLHCLSDSYFILGDYENAMLTCPIPYVNRKWYLLANRRINLSILSDSRVAIFDLLALFSKQVTKYGRENIELVTQISEILLTKWEKEKDNKIIDYVLASSNNLPKSNHFLFNGTTFSKPALGNVSFYEFQKSKLLEEIVSEIQREAENVVREDSGLPKIGEGWISETRLYSEIKQAFPEYTVLFHGKPDWLSKQHLDIYIPELSLAIEYQGIQHSQPVKFFGGLEAYHQRQKLDKNKQTLCKRMSVDIVYVEEGYNFKDLKQQIEKYAEKIA